MLKPTEYRNSYCIKHGTWDSLVALGPVVHQAPPLACAGLLVQGGADPRPVRRGLRGRAGAEQLPDAAAGGAGRRAQRAGAAEGLGLG